MNRNYFYLVLLVVLISCSKKDIETTSELKVIQPLGVGYTWTYIDSSYINPDTIVIDTSKVGISGKEFINYEGRSIMIFYWNWYKYNSIEYQNYSWLCSNESDGLYHYGKKLEDSAFVITKTMSVKYPVNVGEIWSKITFGHEISEDSTYCYQSNTKLCECISVNEKFNTEMGEFNCIVHTYTKTENEDVYKYKIYHCPNIGYVGSVATLNGKKWYTKSLLSYSLIEENYNNKKSKSTINNKVQKENLDFFGLTK